MAPLTFQSLEGPYCYVEGVETMEPNKKSDVRILWLFSGKQEAELARRMERACGLHTRHCRSNSCFRWCARRYTGRRKVAASVVRAAVRDHDVHVHEKHGRQSGPGGRLKSQNRCKAGPDDGR